MTKPTIFTVTFCTNNNKHTRHDLAHNLHLLSQAGRAGPNQPICAIQPAAARRPDVRDRRQTLRRQTATSLNAPWVGHNKHTRHDLAHDLHLLPFWSNNDKL